MVPLPTRQQIIKQLQMDRHFLNGRYGVVHIGLFGSFAKGTLLLDSICMRLQIIGELVKKIHKNNPEIFSKYSQIEWSNIMRLRDIISHLYDHVDNEIIYDICKNHIPSLKSVIQNIFNQVLLNT